MSKIVQAVNAMITHPELITRAIKGDRDEIFFEYKGKYKWSLSKGAEGHVLWYYPGKESLDTLASLENSDFEQIDMVTYRDSEIGTREAKASFAELYSLLKERVYGMNKVLDDIIDDIPF